MYEIYNHIEAKVGKIWTDYGVLRLNNICFGEQWSLETGRPFPWKGTKTLDLFQVCDATVYHMNTNSPVIDLPFSILSKYFYAISYESFP